MLTIKEHFSFITLNYISDEALRMATDSFSAGVNILLNTFIQLFRLMRASPDFVYNSTINICTLIQNGNGVAFPSKLSSYIDQTCTVLREGGYSRIIQVIAVTSTLFLAGLIFRSITYAGYWIETRPITTFRNIMVGLRERLVSFRRWLWKSLKRNQYRDDRMENFRAGRRLSDPAPAKRRAELARQEAEYKARLKAHALKRPYHPLKNPDGWGEWYYNMLLFLTLSGPPLWYLDFMSCRWFSLAPIASCTLIGWSTRDPASFWTWSRRMGFFWQQLAASLVFAAIIISVNLKAPFGIIMSFVGTLFIMLLLTTIFRLCTPNRFAQFYLRTRTYGWVIIYFNIPIYVTAAVSYLPLREYLPFLVVLIVFPDFVRDWIQSTINFEKRPSAEGWQWVVMSMACLLLLRFF
jgi:hypothetical protein